LTPLGVSSHTSPTFLAALHNIACMDSLRSALDEIQTVDPRRVPDEELEQGVLEMQRASDVMLAARGRWLAEVERRRTYRRDGYLSAAAWLADRGRMSFAAAKREACIAQALERMPVARQALCEGDISSSAVQVLAGAQETNPDEFEDAEAMLVNAARAMPVRELSVTTAEWTREVDASSGELERRMFERRSFTLAPTPTGTWRARGELDPETGHVVHTAMRSVIDAQVRDGVDRRSHEQRGADAIGEICRQWLDRQDRPTIAGDRPHVVVTVDVAALGSGRGRSQLEEAGPIAAGTARRIACDASISRIVTSGRSQPLEVGRRTPVVPPALRRAAIVRDEHCRFPGCDRPQSWCDAHHVVHWADGGETSLANLILLCRPHHRMVHDGGFRICADRTFRRADGTAVGAPP
jgi:Domain of unknown function (DUF222)/HNH endonuclease